MKTSKSTKCVHAGAYFDQKTKGIVSPIFKSTAFDYEDVDVMAYPRYFNTPNQKIVSDKMAVLENAEAALVLSSGMAAISTALFSVLKSGDHAVFQNDLYGGTHHAIILECEKFNIGYSFVNATNLKEVKDAIRDNTKLIYIETPSNPLLQIVDIKAISGLAKQHNLVTIIDNTFASPINQTPHDFGIDIVTHSGTKYLGGHSDICSGVITASKAMIEKMWGTAIHFGGSLNAETCYLLERSLKTLELRVVRQNENAQALAEYFSASDYVKKVYYPGLPSHEGHEIAKVQMNGFSGMLTIDLNMPSEKLNNCLGRLKVAKRAISLGGVETTVGTPVKTSHAKMTPEARKECGITDSMLRVSVGIEGIEDLKNDFDLAFKD